MEEAITTPISEKNKIDTVNKTDKSQASNKTVDTPKIKKIDTVKLLYESRSTRRTETENTVDKSRSIPRSNYYYKINRIEKPSEIYIHKDNLSVSGLYGQGESLSIVTPDNPCIPRKNKRNKTPDTSIIIKQAI